MRQIILIIDRLSDLLGKLSALVLGLMTGLILLEIFLWNIFKKTTLIADEYSAYGLAVLIFLGCGYTLKEKGHIRIDLVLNLLPGRLALVFKFIAGLVSTTLLGYVSWQLGRMTYSAWHYGATSGTLTATPLWVPQLLIVIGAVMFTLQMAVETVKLLPFAAGAAAAAKREPYRRSRQ
ncbi:MAG: TRAP transporter small permease [Deltaproteobacteria bacterium]|nr:TRAP transporter small permease [Candidatus Tharpella sp.]